MNFSNIKIGNRMAMGFGFVLSVTAALVILVLMRFAGVNSNNEEMINNDWIMFSEADLIKEKIQEIDRSILERLETDQKSESDRLLGVISKDEESIDQSLGKLDKLAEDEEIVMLLKIKADRATYKASFSKLEKQLNENQRDEAGKLMRSETRPMLVALAKSFGAFVDLQRSQVISRREEIKKNIETGRAQTIGFGLFALITGIAMSLWITRSITAPLGRALKIAQAVASGDLTSQFQIEHTDETGQLLVALKEMNANLYHIVGQVRTATNNIAGSSAEIASGSMELSGRTESQASSLEETVASMEELTSTVKQNADNAQQANELAQNASDIAVKGGAVVSQVVDTMGAINESSRKIVDIISVIDGIAFQTNILALNAAVEAARAGEQGRGFAVVASEVRNLAQRSAAAAKEIKDLISTSVEKVESGGKLVSDAGNTMREVVESIHHVTDIMKEITAASKEQSQGISQVNEAIIQMDDATQQNAGVVEKATAAARLMQDQALNLTELVGVFKMNF